MHIEDSEAKPLLVTSHICHTAELELSDKFRKHCSLYSMSCTGVGTDLCVDQSYEFTIMGSYNGQRRMMHCAGGDSITLLRRSY
ncbi:hypothetical protein OIU85_024607 [Salix viminalis]|uniref:Uncharacterized protein n=1 Tax=Salix viminalis TaxID=40686 RepID=A0A9Q0U144_SALVM|nr:hypothetical protein OIU85_024607 [Salix viminalis]